MHLKEELYQFLQVHIPDLYDHVTMCFAVEMTINTCKINLNVEL